MKELCIAGAASRGVAYIGALQCLWEQGLLNDLETILGVSVGGLVGALWFLGEKPDGMFRKLVRVDTRSFFDPTLDGGSLLRGDGWRSWVRDLLGTVAMWPMGRFRRECGDLRLGAVSLRDGFTILSGETVPDMPLLEALLASMALPLLFPPITWNGVTYVDGGVIDNFPLGHLGGDALGLAVTGGRWPEGPLGLVGRICVLVSEHMRRMRPPPRGREVRIGVGDFGVVDFEMGLDDKVTLYMRGYVACEEYVWEEVRREVGRVLEGVLEGVLGQVSCG